LAQGMAGATDAAKQDEAHLAMPCAYRADRIFADSQVYCPAFPSRRCYLGVDPFLISG
jgi:hypothetical protein